jgi:hypothetical protein
MKVWERSSVVTKGSMEMNQEAMLGAEKMVKGGVVMARALEDGEASKNGMATTSKVETVGADKLKAIQEETGDEETNTDRRLVIHDGPVEGNQEGDEEEFVFDEGAPEEGLLMGWFTVARYYSGHNLPVKVIFSDLFRIWGDGMARDLGSNRYLLEFSTENTLNFVL